jgi:hypothetical protein
VLLAPAVNRGHYADNYRRLLCKQARARESVTEPGADDHGDHDHRIVTSVVNDENVAPAVNRGIYADKFRRLLRKQEARARESEDLGGVEDVLAEIEEVEVLVPQVVKRNRGFKRTDAQKIRRARMESLERNNAKYATLTLTPITILTPLTLTRLAKLLAKKVAELSVAERSDHSDLDLVTSTGFFNAPETLDKDSLSVAAAIAGIIPTMTHPISGRRIGNIGTQKRKVAAIIGKLMKSFDIGRVEKELKDVWRKDQRNAMNPLLLTTAQDMSNSQSLNNSNFDSINRCEKIASGEGDFFRCILPSSSTLSRANRKIEKGICFCLNIS